MIASNKVPINVAMLIRMLFVLPFDEHFVVSRLDRQFAGLERLNVQNELNGKFEPFLSTIVKLYHGKHTSNLSPSTFNVDPSESRNGFISETIHGRRYPFRSQNGGGAQNEEDIRSSCFSPRPKLWSIIRGGVGKGCCHNDWNSASQSSHQLR